MMDGDSAVEISPANIIIEDQRGVGTTPCHDLPRCCFDDCNGVRLVAIFEGTENGNEDADRTYVFVNGRRVVAENGDVGENCTKLAPGEEYAEITELKKLNGDIKAGEANVNGHRCFEDVDAVDGTAEVENGSGINGEDGNHIMEKTDLFVTEDFKVESEKLDPLEEVDVVYSSESEALRAPNLEDTFKADSSFEVVEKVPESGEEGTNDNGSIDCKQPLKKIEDQPGQLDSNSEMPNSDSQAVNDKKACMFD
ncbi:hypothetical protein SAY87_031619 [Trapa incisa]|uniref:Uncharacterized protein n=1 Tax=Trapa incisa TaxID=236973 RepID=A0AAN7KQ34_9MYRT|nr:hypothetical protein SAY87_031619 [Trapa incisa]